MQISDCRKHYCTDLDSKRMVMTYLFVIKLQHFICLVNHECEDWIWLIHCCITMSSIFEGMLESDVSAFVATMLQFWVQFTYLTSKIQSSMIEYSFNCTQVLIFCRNSFLVYHLQSNNGNLLHHCLWHTVWLTTKTFWKNWAIEAYKNQYATWRSKQSFFLHIFVIWKMMEITKTWMISTESGISSANRY